MFKFIQTATTGIKTTFGKFNGVLSPGLKFYIPIVQRIYIISNKLNENAFTFEIKTKDNVFAKLTIAIQYKVTAENSEKAFYKMESPTKQMNSYIENVVRVTTPTLTLDELFESQVEISKNVMDTVAPKMEGYGLTIENTLIKHIEPDHLVKESMNKINSAKRLKHAAEEEAEAEFIKRKREAEGDALRKELQGKGISAQRKAILDGYAESVQTMAENFGMSPREISNFVLEIQRMDMLERIGQSSNAKTIFMDHRLQGSDAKLMQALENNRS